jgi:hypothetical protein
MFRVLPFLGTVMTWTDVTTEPAKAATTKQRQLIHVGASELVRKPELVHLLDRDEAAQLIDLLLRIKERSRNAND